MTTRQQIAGDGKIEVRWRQWTEIVRLFASRDAKRYRVDPEHYHQLQSGLAHLCQERARSGGPAERDFFRQLERLVGPWVTVDSLDWADREIVRKLWDQCRSVQRILDGRRSAVMNRRSAAFALLAAGMLVAAALALLAIWDGGPQSWAWLLAIQGWLRRVKRIVVGLSFEQQLLILGGVVTAVTIALVWRSTGRR